MALNASEQMQKILSACYEKALHGLRELLMTDSL